ncbi:phasin family protein [Pseudomonas putida]|uniref:phasin family protein n=1 Tax=Pseudomonas putida TaxID=303 RepID=UPI0023638B5C|nr:phasin family protein [Pseudomonas putida]MDD2053411.1 phasin family protein [Pseudomonas putida]
MAGKKNTQKESSSWIGKVEDYSRKIWLAGLGVYSKIDTDGSKLFDTLVKDGEKAEKLTKSTVGKQVDAAKASAKSATSRVGEVKDRALGKWGELEEAFDKRLNSAISRLGVPSRNEVKALHSKVDTLTKQIEKLTGASVTPVSKTAAAKPAAKAAAKPLAKAAAKPAAKTAAKPAAKPAAKAPAKPAAKPVAKTAAAKPAAKAVAKPVAAKPAVKAVAKPTAAKPAAKPAAAKKPVAKKPVAAKPAAAAAKPAAAPVSSGNSASAPTPAAAAPAVPAASTPSTQS